MILCDRDIAAGVASGRIGIEPWDPACLQPSSVDLHLGAEFVVLRLGGEGRGGPGPLDPARGVGGDFRLERREEIVLEPGDFVLGATVEALRVPEDLVARVEGKSSLARIGLAPHVEAGYVDPGFRGRITLELSSMAVAVRLRAGMAICQVSFVALSGPASRPYGSPGLGSHYQGQAGAQAARFDRRERPRPRGGARRRLEEA